MNKEIIQAVYASFYASLNSFMALDIASTYSRDNVIMRKGMPTTTEISSSYMSRITQKRHILSTSWNSKYKKMLQSGRIVHANEINYTTKMNFYQLHLIKLFLLVYFAYEIWNRKGNSLIRCVSRKKITYISIFWHVVYINCHFSNTRYSS